MSEILGENGGEVTQEEYLSDVEEQTDEARQQVETDMQALLSKVQTLTDERDQLKDQVLRAMADFQNFKRRNQQEMTLYRQLAVESFARDLFPVLDNFERTLTHLEAGATVENIMGGVKAVDRQLRQALEAQKIKRIEAIGAEFDPTYHEALGTDDTEDVPEHTVTTEIEAGYRMGDKVIRPARVRIAKRGG